MLAALLLSIAQPAISGADDQGAAVACRTDRDCLGYQRCLDGMICTVPPAVLGRKSTRIPTVEFVASGISRGRFFIELARDRFARSRGLSHRPSMADGWGMLFIFPKTVGNAFTMELMRFPLDMIFVGDDGRVVDIIEDAQPKGRRFVSSGTYRYVLELNAGAARSHGIRVGDFLKVAGVPPR